MELTDILTPEGVIPSLKAKSKKHALQEISHHAAEVTGIADRQILETLLKREKLGSTGIGKGVGIPHGKLAGLDRLHAMVARLDHPVEFDSADDVPVDVIIVLLAPEEASGDHLKALAKFSRLLRDPPLLEKLRSQTTADGIISVLTTERASNAA
ncbi:PTS sugar transporter subunit IIA [Marinibaculum pumilum]|uniref:PTS sugar transporter subunit IIA n=1 Tax=Marinibaculum pumilum TaxID=1766165 RepID=A0ABV7L6Z2_9PROT